MWTKPFKKKSSFISTRGVNLRAPGSAKGRVPHQDGNCRRRRGKQSLAPGVRKFGDDENDRLIRKYGYVGRENVLRLADENEDLRANLSVAAHLIHGSSDGRFSITYCTEKLTADEVRGVSFGYMPYSEAIKKYDPAALKDGYNTVDGEKIFYISNPALGLWTTK